VAQIPITSLLAAPFERRPVGDVSALAESLQTVGLMNPITVQAIEEIPGKFHLIAGAHRVEAAKKLGWLSIEANVVNLDALRSELAIIDENLIRNELTVLERGEHLLRRKTIYEVMNPTAKAGGARPGAGRPSTRPNSNPNHSVLNTTPPPPLAASFASTTARATGVSRDTIEQEVRIASGVTAAVKEQIRSTPIANSKTDLLELARQQPGVQQRAVERVLRAQAEGRTFDVKQACREARQEARREETAAKPVPAPQDIAARIEQADASSLPLEAGTVDLIVTSPPYGIEIGYAGGDVPFADWQAFMQAWLAEAFRVTRHTGRLCVNVPLDTNCGGWRPAYAQTVEAALAAGWRYRTTIVWEEGNVSRSIARGSVDSHAAINVTCGDEMIAVFYKGEWARDDGDTADIPHEDWLAWTNGHWRFGGESRPFEDHPAPFPEELPKRLILLFSGRGATVLDPFAGSGTTALVASRLGRQAIGFDLDPQCVASARRRLAGIL